METMTKLRNMLCEELEEYVEQGRVNEGSIGTIDRITHSIKSIDTILAMKGGRHEDDEKVEEMKELLKDSATRAAIEKALSEMK